MIKELNFAGVYVHPFLIALVMAFIASRPVSLLLNHWELYRYIWHPGLFDTAMLVILYGLFVCLLVPDVVVATLHMIFL